MSERAQQIKARATQAGVRAEADELRLKTGHESAEIAKHRAQAAYLESAVDTLCREADFAADMRKPRPAAGNRLCLAAFGAVPVALEYDPTHDGDEPVALLHAVWIEGRVNSADDEQLFPAQLVAHWNLIVQADYEHHLCEMAEDALDLAAQNAHAKRLEPCPFAAAAAEDRFIAQRDAASYQQVAQ
jgi:hypothetical protein